MVREKRERVIEGLEMSYRYSNVDGGNTLVPQQLVLDAIVLLKRSFTPQEVYDTVIEHAQHDMRFKLGDKIDYSFTDVVDILNIELMCKAGDI